MLVITKKGDERTCEPGGYTLGWFDKYLMGVWGRDDLSGVRNTKGMGSKVLCLLGSGEGW